MLGWHIGVYKLMKPGSLTYEGARNLCARLEVESSTETLRKALVHGERLAVWQTGLRGRGWLDQLSKEGLAVALPRDGYPSVYLATARDLIPVVVAGPPEANAVWMQGVGDILGPGWDGKTVVDPDIATKCDPDEWLFVEVWDES